MGLSSHDGSSNINRIHNSGTMGKGVQMKPCKVCNESREAGFMLLGNNFEVVCFDCQLSMMCQFMGWNWHDVNKYMKFIRGEE